MARRNRPMPRPGRMLVINLSLQVVLFSVFSYLNRDHGLPTVVSACAFALLALGGTITLFALAQRAFARDPHWLSSTDRLGIAWRTWASASSVGWMVSINPFNQSWGQTLLSVPLALLTSVAFCVMMVGFAGRFGSERCCAICDYPAMAGTPAPSAVCPECGSPLTSAVSIAIGRKQRNSRLIVAGLLFFIVGAASPFWARGMGSGINTYVLTRLPTPTLIEQAFANDLVDRSAFQELISRKLTPADAERIALLITQAELPTAPMIKWLEQTATDHELGTPALKRTIVRTAMTNNVFFYKLRGVASALCTPPADVEPDLRDEWFGGMFNLAIFSPPNAKVGQPVRLLLSEAKGTALAASGFLPVFALTEVRIGTQVTKNDSACFHVFGRATRNLTTIEIAEFVPASAGPLNAEVTVWLAYTPYPKPSEYALDDGCPNSLGLPQLRFTPVGTPIPPKQAIWSKRRTFEKTIDIVP